MAVIPGLDDDYNRAITPGLEIVLAKARALDAILRAIDAPPVHSKQTAAAFVEMVKSRGLQFKNPAPWKPVIGETVMWGEREATVTNYFLDGQVTIEFPFEFPQGYPGIGCVTTFSRYLRQMPGVAAATERMLKL